MGLYIWIAEEAAVAPGSLRGAYASNDKALYSGLILSRQSVGMYRRIHTSRGTSALFE